MENTQNQYYYYYGGDEGKLTDITPTENNLQNVNIKEEQEEEKDNQVSLSSKLIENSLINNSDSLPTSPLLLYGSNDNNATYCLPIKDISVNAELHVTTACVSIDIIFDNSSNSLKNDIDALFVLPLNNNDSIITSTNVDINNGQRFLDTTFINNDDATKIRSTKSKNDDENNQASINTFIPNLFRLPIPLKKGDDTIKISVNYIETLQFVQSRYHFFMALNFLNYNVRPNVNIKCSINCLLPGIKYGSTTHNLILTEQENLRCRLQCKNKYNNNLNQDFHLFYSVETNAISAALLYDEGNKFEYDPLKSFVTFINPPINNIYNSTFSRDIIFMLDRSGSMTGKPFDDAVKGLIFALNTLTQYDRFGIIAFDHEQIYFNPTEQQQPQSQENILLFNASPITIEQAVAWLHNIRPRGTTDIKNPLMKSLDFLNKNCGNNLPFIILLTDGCVENEKEIVQNVINLKQENKTRICTFGIGPYCNEYFLKMLSSRSSGFNDGCIYPKDLYPKIKLMMDKAKTPILTNVKLSGIDSNEIYPKTIPDLFLNAPIIISGKFENDITPNQIIKITGTLQNGEILEIPIRCDKSDIIPINKIFIKQRMDELNGEYWLYGDDKIKQQIINLSINESFPSPHTSMIAYEISPKEKDNHNAKKKNKGMNGKQIAALAGGAVVVGAGLFLLGNLAATAGNLNILDAVSSGFEGIGDMFGGISLDCPCDACIDGIPCLECVNCGQIAAFLSCGACADCDGCLDAIPCFNGGCNDIPCCDEIGNLCGSCCGIFNACTDSLGDICGSCGNIIGSCGDVCGDICGSCGNIVGSCGDVCGDVCGNLGNICGDISGCFGDICGIIGDIGGSCSDILKAIPDNL